MRRTLLAVLTLTVAACSSGGSSGTGTTAGANSTGRAATGSGGAGSSGGSSATTTGGGNGGAVTVDNFNAAFNLALCKFEVTCQDGYAPYVEGLCTEGLSFADESGLPLAVDAGRVSFDVAQATACLDAFAAQTTCSDLLIFPCYAFLEGTAGLVPPAGACYSKSDCISDSCAGNNTTSCTAGTCAGLVGVGGACDCPNCGTCDPDAGLTCTNSACTPPATIGQPCSNVSNGTDPACAFGLICVGNVCESVPVNAGNPCSTGSGECAAGTYCYEAAMANTGACATLVAAGQPCGEDANHQQNAFSLFDNECAGSRPVCLGAGTLMDSGVAPGICSTLSDMGGPCTPPSSVIDPGNDYNNGCYKGLNCVGGACVKPPSTGPCSSAGTPCDISLSFCASATSTCTPYLTPGQTCNPSDSSPCGLTGNCETPNNICQGNVASCTPTL